MKKIRDLPTTFFTVPNIGNLMKNVMPKFRSSLVLSVGLLWLGTVLRSQAALAVFDFNSSNSNSSDTDANSTASALADTGLNTTYANPGFPGGDNTTAIRFTAKSISGTQRNDYFSFTVTASSGFLLNVSSLAFQYASSTGFGANQLHWAVRSSLDTFATDIASGATTANSTWFNTPTIDLGTSHDNLSSVTFRIYAWDGSATGNKNYGYLDNVVLDGVSVVPEPTNVALAIFGLGVVGLGAGRHLCVRKRA